MKTQGETCIAISNAFEIYFTSRGLSLGGGSPSNGLPIAFFILDITSEPFEIQMYKPSHIIWY